MRSWWQARRAVQFQRYLGEHPDTVLAALRQSPAMAAAAVTAYYAEALRDLQAAGERKTAPWPILSQLGHGARDTIASTLPKVSPYNLRRFSEYPPARKAINTICSPILALPWTVQKIVEPGQSRRSLKLTTADHQCIEVASRCLRQPNDDEGWRPFARKVLEDMVVGGYGAIETQPTGDPLRPWVLYPVDGQSIRINANWEGDSTESRYSQALAYGGISVGTHERVQLRDDELIYLRLHPRTNTPFGLGYLEVAFGMINAWLGAFEYAERRASNATPNFGIHLGENVGPEQVRAFRVYWQEQIEGYGNVPITGGGKEASVLDFRSTGEDQLYLKWQEWVVRMIGLAFGLSPLTMSLERDVNRGTSQIMDVQEWDAIAPVLGDLEYYFTEELLWKRFGYRDLEFKMLRKDADELRQAQINELKYTMNMLTIDELRERDELEPLPGGVGGMTKSQYEAWAAASMQGGELPGIGGPPMLDDEYRSEGGDAGVPVEHAPEARPPLTLQAWAGLERWRRAAAHGHGWDVSLERARHLVGRNGSLMHATDDTS